MKSIAWESEEYYNKAHLGSLDITHPGMKLLIAEAKTAKKIIDLGCGEGTRLNILLTKGKKTGIDISKIGIKKAKKKYPEINFVNGNLENIKFKNGEFDLVYSAYVLEHLDHPEKVLMQAIRLTDNRLILIAPNYGAPNRASPCFKGNRIIKLVKGFIKDFLVNNNLNWAKVEPIASKEKYEMDWDTLTEPYAGSLIKYMKSLGMRLDYVTTCWDQEDLRAKLIQRLFRILGERGIYPFKYWGPHIVVKFIK